MGLNKKIIIQRIVIFLVLAGILMWIDASRRGDELEGRFHVSLDKEGTKLLEKNYKKINSFLKKFNKHQHDAIVRVEHTENNYRFFVNINTPVDDLTDLVVRLQVQFNQFAKEKYSVKFGVNDFIKFSKKEYKGDFTLTSKKSNKTYTGKVTLNIDSVKQNIRKGREIIVFWHAMGGHMEEALVELVNEYNNSQDKAYIQHVNMGNYGTLQQKILGSVFAKQTPDVAQMFEALSIQLIDGKKLVCLQDFVDSKEHGINTKDIIKVFRENNTYYGKIWSLPFNKSVPILYYNKDMFREVGLDPNMPPKTWKDMVHYCKKLTRDVDGDGIIDNYGVAFKMEDAWGFETYMVSAGGKLINNEQTEVYFNSKAGFQTVQFFADLLAKHKVAYTSTGFNHQNDFTTGKTAMFWGSVVSKNFMVGKFDFELGMAPLPYKSNPSSIISGTNVCIFKSNKKKELECWKFMKFLTNTKNSAKWAIATNYMPIRYSSLKYKDMLDAMDKDSNIAPAINQLDYATFEPRNPNWYTSRMDFQKAMEKALRPFDSYSKDYINSAGKTDEKAPSYDHIQKILDETNEEINSYINKD